MVATGAKLLRPLIYDSTLSSLKSGIISISRTMTSSATQNGNNYDEPEKLRPLVISGPSGGGKSTLLKRLFNQFPNMFAFSVSHTTRKPREGEVDGKDYHFSDRAVMEESINNDEFLEHAEFGSNLYGTSKRAVEQVLETGKICVLDIELQGVRNIKKSHIRALYVFVRPPSVEDLKKRLLGRKTETDESLELRLKHAREDMDAVEKDPDLFDNVVINDVLDTAYEDFLRAISSELNKFKRIQQNSK